MYIKTARGSKKIVRNSFILDIFDLMRPALRSGNIDRAVSVAVNRIIYYFYHKPTRAERLLYFVEDHFLLLLIVGFVSVYSILRVIQIIQKRRVMERQRIFAETTV